MNTYFVYIMANKRNGTLYVGVTNNLARRTFEHQSGEISGFTKKYDVKSLVYYESYSNIEDAIRREKRLKKWDRKWKLGMIENFNPDWQDLTDVLNH